ncbi:hypothetical protein [Kineococcus esterisolvens]|uniref:hypothetical protein n=1 Tax=unclassified Kineococcus TaxID=2621656 RepID=UPI003D7CCDBE
MKLRKTVAGLVLLGTLSVAACSADATEAAQTTSTTSTTSGSSTTGSSAAEAASGTAFAASRGRGPGGGVDVSSVTTEDELIALVQEAYGDGTLDLHRGHQPVQDVLDEVLAISHDELHVRMDAGQNLAAVATDLGIDPQTLVDALVESWSPAIDDLLAAGEITEEEAEQYRQALEEAFTFRVEWDGEQAEPTFSGIGT